MTAGHRAGVAPMQGRQPGAKRSWLAPGCRRGRHRARAVKGTVATDLVEGVGRPLHDMEVVHDQPGVQAPGVDDVGDPLGPVRGHLPQAGAGRYRTHISAGG